MTHLPSLAALEDLSERLGVTLDPGTPDGLRAQRTLDDASALVRATAGMSWSIDAVPEIVAAVTVAVAYRAYKNPEGSSQASVGDVSVSYAGTGDGSLYLTRQETKAIRKAAGRSAVGSVAMTGDILLRDPYYAPAPDPFAEPIPLGPLPWRP